MEGSGTKVDEFMTLAIAEDAETLRNGNGFVVIAAIIQLTSISEFSVVLQYKEPMSCPNMQIRIRLRGVYKPHS